jgi:hypothetical protein
MGVINCTECDRWIDLDCEQEYYPPGTKEEDKDCFENAMCESCHIEKYPNYEEE